MNSEITAALIALVGATCASIIAFVGIIIGLASTYILQILQRRWTLDDQRREWKRADLIKTIEYYKQLDKILSNFYFDAEYSPEIREEIKVCLSDLTTQVVPINDSKINEFYENYSKKISEFISQADIEREDSNKLRTLIDEADDVGERLLKRINILIEETYK